MPIHINLLAEAQALEDLRRRDPVKRAIWIGAFLGIAMLAVASWLELQVIIRRGDLNRVEGQIATRQKEFQQVLDNQKKLNDVNHKLASLQNLATNRLLYGTLLSALQQTMVDNVQLTRFRADQAFLLTEEVKPKTNSNDHVVPGKPANVTERVSLTLDARDSGPNPGDQVNKFKRAVVDCPYFQDILGKTNGIRLTSLSPPQGPEGQSFVQFTLECRFPERTRQ